MEELAEDSLVLYFSEAIGRHTGLPASLLVTMN